MFNINSNVRTKSMKSLDKMESMLLTTKNCDKNTKLFNDIFLLLRSFNGHYMK